MSDRPSRYNKEVHQRLIQAAKTQEEFVEYPEIISLAGLSRFKGDALGGELGHLFYDIIQQDWAEDKTRPMLSAVAISSSSGGPGDGFYRLAREVGRLKGKTETEELTFWVQELAALRKYWRDHSDE
jgi:hypothetical protein